MTESNSEILARLVERFEKPAGEVDGGGANEQKISRENTEEKLAEIRAAIRDSLISEHKIESQTFSALGSLISERSPSQKTFATNNSATTFGRVWREAFENKRDKIA